MCQTKPDSNSHMLLHCDRTKNIWSDFERWITQLGVNNYVLTENNIITGEINKSRLLTVIILFAKVTIYTAKINEKIPNFFNFKNLLKQQYVQAKYMANISGKIDDFEKEWHLLFNEWQ